MSSYQLQKILNKVKKAQINLTFNLKTHNKKIFLKVENFIKTSKDIKKMVKSYKYT